MVAYPFPIAKIACCGPVVTLACNCFAAASGPITCHCRPPSKYWPTEYFWQADGFLPDGHGSELLNGDWRFVLIPSVSFCVYVSDISSPLPDQELVFGFGDPLDWDLFMQSPDMAVSWFYHGHGFFNDELCAGAIQLTQLETNPSYNDGPKVIYLCPRTVCPSGGPIGSRRILTEDGDPILTEDGDNLIYEP